MKKKIGICYIFICMAVCILPFAGMTVFATNTTTENKTLAEFPILVTDGKINTEFIDELSEYFEDHFAFRELLVNIDAEIQSKVFRVSNVDTVITGEDGWLYYSATLDDYLGQNLMSDREVYNAAHNISLIQQYVESQGAQFVLAIAPNKNSLYGENMPYYYSEKVSEEKNIDNLEAELESQEVSYADMFTAFENTDEVLYLKRDSHWNNKGALLAYHEILSVLNITHDLYEDVSVLRTKTETGDLNMMIYPLTSEPEWNYYYQYETKYTYVTETESVENAWIETSNSEGEGILLMFRDSFGNTLLPLMANTFESAYFSKSEPYSISSYMEEYSPDVVVIEKVERNISDFASMPPVMQTVETELEKEPEIIESGGTFDISESENDTSYWCISGILNEANQELQADVYVRITSGATTKTFEAFNITTGESDYGYTLYISKEYMITELINESSLMQIEIISVSDDGATTVYSEEIDFMELY